MPSTTTTKHKGVTLTFTEADHKYVDDRGQTYTSVTTLLHKFFEPFDEAATAARMEAQGKGVASELIEVWHKNRDDACDYGTRVHQTAEARLLGQPRPHEPRDARELLAFSSVEDFCTRMIIPKCKVIKPESVLFVPEWGISGTADLCAVRHDGVFVIGDWKSNKSIDREGFRGKMALGHISHLPDCNWTKYCLQLNIYQQMLLHGGYVPWGTKFSRVILWIPPGENRVEAMPVPDMAAEALGCIVSTFQPVPF